MTNPITHNTDLKPSFRASVPALAANLWSSHLVSCFRFSITLAFFLQPSYAVFSNSVPILFENLHIISLLSVTITKYLSLDALIKKRDLSSSYFGRLTSKQHGASS